MRYLVLALFVAALTVACGGQPVPAGGQTAAPTSTPASTPTPTLPPSTPVWLDDLVASFEDDRGFLLSEYRYGGRTVYLVEPPCCDRFTDLYDASGALIAHPSGGIAGRGDGRASDFAETATLVRVVWPGQQPRVRVLAPIVSVDMIVAESFPPQYFVHIVSALPNGCHRLDGWEMERDGAGDVRVSLYNTLPDPATLGSYFCSLQFGTAETTVPLGTDFVSGTAYTVFVNGEQTGFTAQ